MRVRRKCTSTIYSNTRAENCSFKTKEIDQAAAKLAMGISEFDKVKTSNITGFVNCKLDMFEDD